MARRLIDLTTPVTTGHFRWPVERRLLKSHAEDAGQGTWAGWNVHGFTHMDSPATWIRKASRPMPSRST